MSLDASRLALDVLLGDRCTHVVSRVLGNCCLSYQTLAFFSIIGRNTGCFASASVMTGVRGVWVEGHARAC